MGYEFKLERFAEEMEYGTILRWLKREGDAVSAGEVIVEIEAEKVNQEVESPVSGRIDQILAFQGDEIKVGETMAVIAETA
jgi:2-oxoglutarate dehydrogenase E2 component (dihydrolipoamide succinyltransferase)